MRKGIVTFRRGDIVVVPFPYTDLPVSRVRPALILSEDRDYYDATGQLICAMITGARKSSWPGDHIIEAWQEVGLTIPSLVRLKITTFDKSVVKRTVGRLDDADIAGVLRHARRLLT